jgi:very-short-patch-repair endonuclease
MPKNPLFQKLERQRLVLHSHSLVGWSKTGLVYRYPVYTTPVFDHPSVGGECRTAKVVLTTIENIRIKRNFVEDLPYNPKLKDLARSKRKEGILSEVLFWQQVHKKKFHKIDFDRQRIIGSFIVDFYVKALGLVVEIDGRSHDNKQEYDAQRQAFLENLGLRVYRIPDSAVKKEIGWVMTCLERYIIAEYGLPPIFEPGT